jgi:hypothetical protein
MNYRILSVILAGMVAVVFGDKQVDPWDAFAPPADKKFDWLQMNSGEWLKGELKVMYNYSLEFDSDELDLLKLDFDDVRQIRSSGEQRILVETGRRETEVMSGRLVMNGENVQLISGPETNHLKRIQVVSIAGGANSERENWSGSFSIGATLRGGNTETADLTSQVNIRRRTALNRFNVDYLSNYSAARDFQTANNHRLNGYYDWFLTSRFYWQVVAAEYYRDPFINIGDQYSVGTGAGYDLIRTSKTEWTLIAGVGYQETRFASVVPPAASRSSSPFTTVGTRLDYEINGNIDFLYDYSTRFLNKTSGRYTHHMVTTLSVELIGDLDLDVTFIWDRIENPQSQDDGAGGFVTPEQDDYQLVVGVGYDF